MTVSMAGPHLTPAMRTNGADKPGRDVGGDDGFRDALAGTSAKQKPAAMPRGDERMRPTWTIGGQAGTAPAEAGALMPAVRFALAADIPGAQTPVTMPTPAEPRDEQASGEDGGEQEADGALALLGEMMGRDTPPASGNSEIASTSKPSKETAAGVQPDAVETVAAAPADPEKAAQAATTVTTSEIAHASTTATVIPQVAGERASQRAPAPTGADGESSATSRTATTSASATGPSSMSQSALGDVTVPEPAQAKEAAAAGARNDTARQDQRTGDAMAAARPQEGQAQPADGIAGRVNVVGFNSSLAPSPALQGLSTTSAGVVAAIEADPAWRAASHEFAAAGSRQQNAGPVQSLRIQLNPAELGMVTARLTTHGQQLSVEIQTESADAHRKLISDSEAILKALRGIGYDVDKVTIQQAPTPTNAANAQAGSAGRDTFQPNQQAQGEGGGRGQGERGGAASGSGEGNAHGPAETAADRTRGDIYI
jgi:chemotaxis protein MotD